MGYIILYSIPQMRYMYIISVQHLDHDDLELEVDYSLFDEYLWPSLAHRVPALESLKVTVVHVLVHCM